MYLYYTIMPPKTSKPKKQSKNTFRRGVRANAVKKGKKKASQKQVVNVTVTSTGSGSGGSSMGVPSQPIFIPNNYQQPLFTPAVDPIKNTLTEVVKPVATKVSQGSQVDMPDEIPPRTPTKSTLRFEDVYGYHSNPMYSGKSPDSGYHSAPETAPRRPPRVSTVINGEGIPPYAGHGRKTNLRKEWEASQKK